MNDFLHEFLFSDLLMWNPHYFKETYKERVEEQDEFDRSHGYIPRDMRGYVKSFYDMDRRKKLSLINEKKINYFEDIDPGYYVGGDHNFSPSGPFENIKLPKAEMYNNPNNARYYNYFLNKKQDDEVILEKHKNDFIKSILGYITDNPAYAQLNEENLKKIPEAERKSRTPIYNSLYEQQSYNPKYEAMNPQIHQYNVKNNLYKKNNEEEEYFKRQLESVTTESIETMEEIDEEIRNFQQLIHTMQNKQQVFIQNDLPKEDTKILEKVNDNKIKEKPKRVYKKKVDIKKDEEVKVKTSKNKKSSDV